MKKFVAGLLVLFVLMIGLPLSAEAHNGCPRHRRASRSNVSRNYYRQTSRYRSARTYRSYRNYRTAGYSYQRPSFYRRHRNLINLGIATGGGALIGGIAGGRRGAGLGALTGLGAGALYTYVLNKKRRRY
ncbi:MAG TPA: hypothetical protein VF604_07945 [Pyrinomonadaceae bacterium]|jgi:hypothetical protein